MPARLLFNCGEDVHGFGNVANAWDPAGTVLASCGSNLRVHIWSRNGDDYDQFQLTEPGTCLSIAWDFEGEQLGILQEGNSKITIWNRRTKTKSELNTNFKDPCLIIWSKVGSQLAIGTGQGNLLMYNSKLKRKVPIIGKHSKKIICGAWSLQNKLALCSVDKMVTISDAEGVTLQETTLRAIPISMQFSNKKNEEKKKDLDSTLSMNMEGKTVFMFDLDDILNPVELAFQAKYGDIVDYAWYGDGYLLCCFSNGFVVVISTHMKEIGEELHCLKLHEEPTTAMSITLAGNMFATCATDGVRVVDLSDWRELKLATIEKDQLKGSAKSLDWTKDGQILTVSTSAGTMSSFLVAVPPLGACFKSMVVFLSSLRELTYVKNLRDDEKTRKLLPLDIEPGFIAIGDFHIAVGMNNSLWIYSTEDQELIQRLDCIGSIKSISMNRSHCAVLTVNGQIQLISIVGVPEAHEGSQIFPGSGDNNITTMRLIDRLLIYGDSNGCLYHFVIQDQDSSFVCKQIDEYRHNLGISCIFPSPAGTRSVVIDDSGNAFLFNPSSRQKTNIAGFPAMTRSVLWDLSSSSTIFVAVGTRDERSATTFVYSSQSINGDFVSSLEKTTLPAAFTGLVLDRGCIYGLRACDPNKLSSCTLASHDLITAGVKLSPDRHVPAAMQYIQLGYLSEAWRIASANNLDIVMKPLFTKALLLMDMNVAINVCRYLGHVSKVMELEKMQHFEELNLLSASIFLLQNQYDDAEKAFLLSNRPKLALNMRRDLLQWDRAYRLTQNLDPDQISLICFEHAGQLELRGSYDQAAVMYQRAIDACKSDGDDDVRRKCQKGLARIAMHMGDVQKGRQIIAKLDDPNLMRECASVLENDKQYLDAADLYVRCQAYEKAASIYIYTKNYKEAAPLMKLVSTPKLHALYAKAQEKQGNFMEAERAYEIAEDTISVVRLNLEHLDPTKAFSIVRKTRCAEGADLVAEFSRQHRDYDSAIEFLMLSQRLSEAFQLAEQSDRIDLYVKYLGDRGTAVQYERIASYYENRKEMTKAAKCYLQLHQYQRAIRLFLQGDDNAIEMAIDVIRKTKDDPNRSELVGMIERCLLGESDGRSRDPRHVLQLLIALEEYSRAGKMAVIMAEDEQRQGRYKSAHWMLVFGERELRTRGVPVPEELNRCLVLLHSYVLVKYLVQSGDHEGAARMLIRVAKNISKFGEHVVPILTSAVIECVRAGMRKSAYEFAAMLMRPEYRQLLNAKVKRKIEDIVRRRAQEEEEEATSPCPYCSNMIPETVLDCVFCKNSIAFCSVTGKHMVLTEWSECPSCKFPGLYQPLMAYVSAQGTCPMCDEPIQPSSLFRIPDPLATKLSKKTDIVPGQSENLSQQNMKPVLSTADFKLEDFAPEKVNYSYREAILNSGD